MKILGHTKHIKRCTEDLRTKVSPTSLESFPMSVQAL